jgi:sulfur relay protein TusB/DsrH
MNTIYVMTNFDEKSLNLIPDNTDGHGLILMQDAVLLSQKKNNNEKIGIFGANGSLFVLKPDVLKRGITEKMVPGVHLIDHEELIDLLFNGAKILNL